MLTRNRGHVITCTWRTDQPQKRSSCWNPPIISQAIPYGHVATGNSLSALFISGRHSVFRLPAWSRYYFFFSKQSRLALGHVQPLFFGTCSFFPGRKSARVWCWVYCIYITHPHLGPRLWLCILYLRSAMWRRGVHMEKLLCSNMSSKDLRLLFFFCLLSFLPSCFLSFFLSFVTVLYPFTICFIRSCLSRKGTFPLTQRLLLYSFFISLTFPTYSV